METLCLNRCSFSLGAAAALLAGCGGASQSPASATPQVLSGRTMPKTSESVLIYASNADAGRITVFTYPQGPSNGWTGAPGAEGECADSAGNVFVAATTGTQDHYTGHIYEFANGDLTAIFADPHWSAGGCAADPETGGLAVTGYQWPSAKGGIVFYNQTMQKRVELFTSTYRPLGSCAYDPSGNLYVSVSYNEGKHFRVGVLLLPTGSTKFELMTIDKKIADPSNVQWAGDYLIVTSSANNPNRLYVYELSVKGNKTTIAGTTELHTYKHRDVVEGPLWVLGDTVLAYSYYGKRHRGHIGTWAYPAGGLPRDKIDLGAYAINGLAAAPAN
jgi:hypothetical protein